MWAKAQTPSCGPNGQRRAAARNLQGTMQCSTQPSTQAHRLTPCAAAAAAAAVTGAAPGDVLMGTGTPPCMRQPCPTPAEAVAEEAAAMAAAEEAAAAVAAAEEAVAAAAVAAAERASVMTYPRCRWLF